jgi:predicted Zn-dependent peptidase
MRRTGSLIALCALAAGPAPGRAQQPAPAANAFANVETVILPNGLKVWFKRLRGDPMVSVSVAVPAGSDEDPPGLEQLAHFTEHMLFSDQPGRTEAQVKHEVDERGGSYNGFTTWDRTFYYVRIGRAHGSFAIDWMSRLVAPHAMDAAVVERQREPVALEVRARPREFFDWLFAHYIDPPLLRVPGFWGREFGLASPRETRDYYPWQSVHRIAPGDLRGFYDRYYVPSRMTLTVVGDLDRDSTLALIRSRFGSLPARPASVDAPAVRESGRRRATYGWTFRSNVSYDRLYRFVAPDLHDRVTAIFLTRWLEKRLNDRLRFGDRKAAYGIGVASERRGSAGYLYVSGGLKTSEYAFARGVVDEEIETLRGGTRAAAEFEADRAAVASQLRVQDATARHLEQWVWNEFYDDRTFRDFPDLVTAFETMPQRDVETFVRRRLVPASEVLDVTYPMPMSEGAVAIVAALLCWLAVRVAQRLLQRPVDMTRIRYVARFHVPLVYKVTLLPLAVASVAVALRLVVYALQVLADRVIVEIDSFWIQWSLYALFAIAIVVLMVALLGRIPRKLLCFDDAIVIKYLAFRSVRIAPGDIVEVAPRRFADVWLSRRLWSCMPLTLGIVRPAVYLRCRNGRSWFFSVRDTAECLRVLGAQP